MTKFRRVLLSKDDADVSTRVMEVIESHLGELEGGEPTAAFVQRVCSDLSSPAEKGEVLFFFMVESPLRAQDLVGMCRSVGAEAVRDQADRAARLRAMRLHTDRKPICT